MFSNDAVQHPSEEVESTPLPEIHQGEGGRKAVHCLGIHQVQEVPVLIHQSVSLACAPGTTLSSSVGIPFVVFGLVRIPTTELILVLDEDLHLGKGRWLEQEQKDQE